MRPTAFPIKKHLAKPISKKDEEEEMDIYEEEEEMDLYEEQPTNQIQNSRPNKDFDQIYFVFKKPTATLQTPFPRNINKLIRPKLEKCRFSKEEYEILELLREPNSDCPRELLQEVASFLSRGEKEKMKLVSSFWRNNL